MLNLTYGDLMRHLLDNARRYPNLDLLNQPVTLADPNESGSYYNIDSLVKEEDGHFTLTACMVLQPGASKRL